MTEQIAGYCTLCRSRCGSLNLVEDGRLVEVQPLPDHPTGGALCAKGRAAPEIAGSPRRLTAPLRRTNPRSSDDPGWEEISWEEALTDIAARLTTIKTESGAEAVSFAATTPSGTPIVDSIDWIERLVRKFGSPNLIYAVEICGWHKDYAHALTFGRGAGVPDYEEAETILLWGHNPARTWLAQASRIATARSRGATVVVIDPKRAGSGQQSDIWLRVRPGTDAALALGAIRHLISTDSYDVEFVREWTNAPMLVNDADGKFVSADTLWADGRSEDFVVYDQRTGRPRSYDSRFPAERPNDLTLEETVNLVATDGSSISARPAFALLVEHCASWTPEAVAEATTIGVDELQSFFDVLSRSTRVAYHSWTGVGQHSNATQTERCIATLYALLGACDRSGGNLWLQPPPVNPLAPYDLLPEGQKAKALGLEDLPLGPPRLGWVTARHFCRAVLEGEPYRVRGLVSFGNNMTVSQADGDRSRAAIEELDLYVHVDMFMNPTAEMADYVLPANSPWERDALKVGFEITQEAVEYIQFRPQMIPSVGQSRPDYIIAIDLARHLGLLDEFFDGDVRAGWAWHLAPTGINLDDLIEGEHSARSQQPVLREKYSTRSETGTVTGFATPTRRVELYSQQLLDHGYRPLPSFVAPLAGRLSKEGNALPLVLSTHKNGFYVHSSHRHVASLRRRAPDPNVEMSGELAANRGLIDGDWAVIETANGTTRAKVKIDDDLHPSVVLADFGWWEDCPPLGLPRTPVSGEGSLNINAVLSDDEHDPTSGSVPLRAVACDVRPEEVLSLGNWTGRQPVRVLDAWLEAEGIVGLRLVLDSDSILPHVRPGQHILLAPREEGPARAYSLTRSARSEKSIEIAVRRIDDGVISGFVHHEIDVGSLIWLERPQGVFTPPLSTDRPVILVAGGVGITPFLGYLRALRVLGEQPRSLTLLTTYRNGAAHPFRQELQSLVQEIPQARMLTWYSRPTANDRSGKDFDLSGRMSLRNVDLPVDERPLVYLCGASGLMDSVTAELVERGVPRYDLFREDFQAKIEVPKDIQAADVRLGENGQTIRWEPKDGTILRAAEQQGISLPSGCRVGQCESCALPVLEGSVAHLGGEPADDVCLTCVAVPIGDVVLDT
ncbi:Anaerobic selenocysteine-containing dehydrogenase [Brevibacterium aurantiacum]|uniref:Anaerobic selenocysteine-containing dehydrogenase n=1 Tax=Brevibacterium aurantiacum TaxID=273384 RepID=A0A2H1KX54_BREAU|nr:molybdopterin-dependent oxidoreductase [Brevibacterium aurantiacum]SMY04353.1 Anaerobic selenocysteine-containing dehydrogenase [Brevibacterium aurantiacum]